MSGKTIMVCGIGASIGVALWMLFGGTELLVSALLVFAGWAVVSPFTRVGDYFFVPLFFRLTGGSSLLDDNGHVTEND